MPAQEKKQSAGESSVGPVEDGHGRPSRREIYEASLSGAREQDELRIPLLRSDVQHYERLAHSLAEFRMQEGDKREERLRRLWKRLPQFETVADGETVLKDGDENDASFSREKARDLKKVYETELVGRCRDIEKPHAGSSLSVSWNQFYKYAEAKEVGM
jgi:solute carrier family 25 (mitochondrial phosphate transporter), member 23/24/25/41